MKLIIQVKGGCVVGIFCTEAFPGDVHVLDLDSSDHDAATLVEPTVITNQKHAAILKWR